MSNISDVIWSFSDFFRDMTLEENMDIDTSSVKQVDIERYIIYVSAC